MRTHANRATPEKQSPATRRLTVVVAVIRWNRGGACGLCADCGRFVSRRRRQQVIPLPTTATAQFLGQQRLEYHPQLISDKAFPHASNLPPFLIGVLKCLGTPANAPVSLYRLQP
jgi:hypothetical protein